MQIRDHYGLLATQKAVNLKCKVSFKILITNDLVSMTDMKNLSVYIV